MNNAITAIVNLLQNLIDWMATSWVATPAGELLLCSGIGMIAIVIGIVLGSWILRKTHQRSLLRLVNDNLLSCALVLWICGFVLCGWNYWIGTHEGNLIVWLPRTIVASFRMFIKPSEILDIKGPLQDNPFYASVFSVVYSLGVLLCMLFVLKVVGYQVRSYLRMSFCRLKLWGERKDLYVFWGINENSLLLAESIYKKASNKKFLRLVFVDLPEDNVCDSNVSFRLFTGKHVGLDDIYRMERMNAYLIRARTAFKDIIIAKKKFKPKRIYSLMGVGILAHFIDKSKNTKFYFLSDDEERNLGHAKELITLYKRNPNIMPTIYCHAHYTEQARILSLCAPKDKVQIADSARLSILQLMQNPKYQPVNFVDIDYKKAIVTSPFHALVVGFGATGCEALKFLYEFSALLGEKLELIDRKLTIVDYKLKEEKERFLAECPALWEKNEVEWFDDCSVNSPEFWRLVSRRINQLNYVVIALGDDELALEVAHRLYQYAYQNRRRSTANSCISLQKFKIFVRLKEKIYAQRLMQIASYYAEKSNRDDRGDIENSVLVPFGTYCNLFSQDVFDNEIIDKHAKIFGENYDILYGEISKCFNSDSRPWNGVAEDVKANTNRQQNISNARHVYTKRILAGVCPNCGTIGHLSVTQIARITNMTLETINKNGKKTTKANFLNADKDWCAKIENLSLCEHLRWNAKMELLGFTAHAAADERDYPVRDYIEKTHECLVPCAELNTKEKFLSVKAYDGAVVQLSFDPKILEPELGTGTVKN